MIRPGIYLPHNKNQDGLTRLIVRTSHIFELYFVTTELNFPACRFDP